MASAIWINFIKENITKEFESLYIPINCKFLIIKKFNGSNYEIQDIYQVGENYSKIYNKFAEWKNEKLEIYQKNLDLKRMNLHGYQFNVAETFVSMQFIRLKHF